MANDTRTRILETTGLLLRQRGYHGTSLNDILSASGAPRGSLYFHFPGGKDQLVIEVTRDSVARVTERLGEALAAEKDPAVAVHHIYQSVARMLEDNQFSLGCPIAPVVLELADRRTGTGGFVPLGLRAVDRLAAGGLRQGRGARAPRPRFGAAGRIVTGRIDGDRPRHPRPRPAVGGGR